MLIGVSVSAMLIGCATQYEVHPVTEGSLCGKKEAGVYYVLPKTALTINIPLTCTAAQEGDLIFSNDDLAKWFIDFPEIPALYNIKGRDVTENKQNAGASGEGEPLDTPEPGQVSYSYGIDDVKEITIGSTSVVDPENIYEVVIGSKFLEDKNTNLTLTEGGFLVSSNAQATNRTGDYILASLQAAASIAHIAMLGGTGAPIPGAYAQGSPSPGPRAGNTVPKLSYAKKAERLVQLYKAKLTLLSTAGSASPDATLQKQLDGLDAAIGALAAQFTNKPEKKDKRMFQFRVIPCAAPQSFTLIGLTKDEMTLTNSYGEQGEDFFHKFENPAGNRRYKIEICAKITKLPDTESFLSNISNSKASPNEEGLRYRIPATCQIDIVKKVTALGEGDSKSGSQEVNLASLMDCPIAQLGIVQTLPPDTDNNSGDFNVVMFAATGALQQVQVTSVNMDPSKIATIADAAATGAKQGINDSINSANAGELNKLAQQKQLIDAQAALLESQQNLKKLKDGSSSSASSTTTPDSP